MCSNNYSFYPGQPSLFVTIYHMQRARVLGSYRALLRARDATFKGDSTMQQRVTQEIKNAFYLNDHVKDENEIEKLVMNASEAANFIRFGIVQATKNSEDQDFSKLLIMLKSNHYCRS